MTCYGISFFLVLDWTGVVCGYRIIARQIKSTAHMRRAFFFFFTMITFLSCIHAHLPLIS